MFTCAYCRVKLFLSGRECFRYYILPAEDVHEEICYVPYWRFKGLDFSVAPFAVTGKYVDQTILARGQGAFPGNLGFRPQVLTLRFVSPKTPGRFLPAAVPMHDAFAVAEAHASSFGDSGRVFHRAFIGKTASLLYAPVYEKDGALYDAVLKRRLLVRSPAIAEELNAAQQQEDWSVEFLSTLCPECGWQLTGEKESAVFICGNCVSVWEMTGRTLERVECIVADGNEEEGLCYAPFWRIAVAANGIALETYADFARAVNLPKAIRPEWEEQKLFFWFPAFKTRPDLFLRLATLLVVDQPRITEGAGRISAERQPLAPITLRAQEAANGLTAVLAKLATKQLFEVLPHADLKLKSAALVLLPFRQNSIEFIAVDLNFRIPRLLFPHAGTV